MPSDVHFTTEQRKSALRAFVARTGIHVAVWEKNAGVGEGTIRNFYKRERGTMTDRTYTRLAQAASAMLGEEITDADLKGTKVTNLSEPKHMADVRPPLPVLLLYRSAAGGAQGGSTLVYMDNVVGEVERLYRYRYAKNAFCTEATDDLMAPLAYARDIIVIDPDKIPRAGDDCLFVRDPEANPLETVFRHLVAIGPTSWTVKEHTGKPPYTLSFADYPKAWPMVSVIKA
jgi:hypothetical protein